jgi:putative flippase GtrA
VSGGAGGVGPLGRWLCASAGVRYAAAGGVSLALDVATLYALRTGLGVHLVVATSIAYVVGLVTNFLINRYVVFPSEQTALSSGARYLSLVAFNYLATIALVSGLTLVSVPYLAAKFFAVACTMLWNFLAYKHWVFTASRRAQWKR